MNINILCAIDFTGSNGEPKNPRSLHFVHPSDRSRLNQYEKSIKDVGEVLEPYDTDKKYSVFGFGAKKVDRNGVISTTLDVFNLHPNDEEVVGVDGIVEVYHQALPHLVLSGPSKLAPIIRQATDIALSKQNE